MKGEIMEFKINKIEKKISNIKNTAKKAFMAMFLASSLSLGVSGVQSCSEQEPHEYKRQILKIHTTLHKQNLTKNEFDSLWVEYDRIRLVVLKRIDEEKISMERYRNNELPSHSKYTLANSSRSLEYFNNLLDDLNKLRNEFQEVSNKNGWYSQDWFNLHLK